MNRVILMGRLTRDPVINYTQGQEPMCIARYNLAVDRRIREPKEGQQTADFISCVAFGRRGEFAEKYLHQGSKIAVEGHIQTGSYTNKDGQKVYTTDVIVDGCEFAESKGTSDQENTPERTTERTTESANKTTEQTNQRADDEFMNVSDGDLPFK